MDSPVNGEVEEVTESTAEDARESEDSTTGAIAGANASPGEKDEDLDRVGTNGSEGVDGLAALSRGVSNLTFSENQSPTNGFPISGDEEYDSPVEAPEKLEDKDFDWDSEM